MTTTTNVATAWFKLTGLRFKGRIKNGNYNGEILTPYGKFPYRISSGLIRFFTIEVEAPSCPLAPEVLDATERMPDGEIEYLGPVLPYRIPLGYKKFEWIDGVAVATRINGKQVMMGNQIL